MFSGLAVSCLSRHQLSEEEGLIQTLLDVRWGPTVSWNLCPTSCWVVPVAVTLTSRRNIPLSPISGITYICIAKHSYFLSFLPQAVSKLRPTCSREHERLSCAWERASEHQPKATPGVCTSSAAVWVTAGHCMNPGLYLWARMEPGCLTSPNSVTYLILCWAEPLRWWGGFFSGWMFWTSSFLPCIPADARQEFKFSGALQLIKTYVCQEEHSKSVVISASIGWRTWSVSWDYASLKKRNQPSSLESYSTSLIIKSYCWRASFDHSKENELLNLFCGEICIVGNYCHSYHNLEVQVLLSAEIQHTGAASRDVRVSESSLELSDPFFNAYLLIQLHGNPWNFGCGISYAYET